MDSRTRFLNACRGEPVDRTPVWFMRQAGRMFPEYRQIRQEHEFLEVCSDPELNARVTCMPVERLGVDAAIIFADILLPLGGMGRNFEFISGHGPVIERPVRQPSDVEDLEVGQPEKQLDYVYNALRATRERLPEDVPIIGFAGAPFTLACYLIEGGKSDHYLRPKQFVLKHPDAWDQLMETITECTVRYLTAQVKAGAEVLQLFDSWVGELSPALYREAVLPYSRRIFQQLRQHDVPTIHFGTGTAGLLPLMEQAGSDVLGVDWRIGLDRAASSLETPRPLQGNLDPSLLQAPFEKLKPHVGEILEEARSLPGHVFNLGHGVLPGTEPDTARRLVELVHERTERSGTPSA